MSQRLQHAFRGLEVPELDYFVDWGGHGWRSMVEHAIGEFLSGDLSGLRILEIGTRSGKVACLLGLLGAQVLGIDINERALDQARKEAQRWKVDDRVQFQSYDGNLDAIDDSSFDVVFTKSVLVVVPELETFLRKLERKLVPGGRIVFIENRRAGMLHYLRAIKHYGRWKYSNARYFGKEEIGVVNEIFHVSCIRKRLIPPICMILGRKRDARSVHSGVGG